MVLNTVYIRESVSCNVEVKAMVLQHMSEILFVVM
jgi:hypothetical protein